MSDPPPKTSEVLTGSSMQIKIQNGNIWAKNWAKNLGKIKYFPKLAIITSIYQRKAGRSKRQMLVKLDASRMKHNHFNLRLRIS